MGHPSLSIGWGVFLCRFKIKSGFQKWCYSLDKISMFDSIRKRGMNRNKYKEKQEVNIKNSTKNYLDMKR